MPHYSAILGSHPIISDQIKQPALSVVLRELEQVLVNRVDGDVVEFGCYIGTTTLFARRVLDELGESGNRQLHVYDSFAGLPEKTAADSSGVGLQFQGGELAVSKKQFLQEFKRAHLLPPIVHKAWFKDLKQQDVPQTIAFAFLDGDFYESIMTSLQLVWSRLSPEGVITIDDYQREALPGPARAVRDFCQNKRVTIHHEHNIGILKAANVTIIR
ncbi:MAG: TylF/MycF/NovP-related O-methyltransferase [Candidatus Saccharibacteria bacterium]